MTLKAFSRALALKVAPIIAYNLIRLIYATCTKSYIGGEDFPKEPTVIGFWHAELLFQAYIYAQERSENRVKVMISDHFDGKLIAKTISYFGADTIHGSSNRSASRVLIQALKHLKEGYDVGITPDGPRGPRHEVAKGIVIMAQKANAKVVLHSMRASRAWYLKSWDRFVIPKPFSHLEFRISSPIDIGGMSMDEAKALIQKELNYYES